MKTIQKIGILILMIAMIGIDIFALYQSDKKATYIEYTEIGQACNQVLEMNHNDYITEQEFTIPYQLFYGVGISIGTYGRENNSTYEATIMDKTLDKVIFQKEFNTSMASDNNLFEIFPKNPIKIDNTHQFSIILKAKTLVNSENGIALYIDTDAQYEGNLYYNGLLNSSDLRMNVYGGDANSFWFLFTLVCEIYIAVLILYSLHLYIHKKAVFQNGIFQAGVLGIIIFTVLSGFVKIGNFSDEIDNIVGGMLINKDYALYVDFYTQHTPIAYFLCALFNILQAGSVMQFRLWYYFLIAFVYAILYLRHREHFGKINMAMLPIVQIAFGVLLANESTMMLSDNIQAIALTALFLEFLQYLKDEKLDWKRSIIVSLCICFSFGVAFVSAYAIFAIAVGVLIKEITYWKKESKVTFRKIMQRYWKIVVICVIPFIIGFSYLILTNALIGAYQQGFKFNTEIYSYYIKDGLGSNIFQPFFIGISNFMEIIPSAIQNIAQNEEILPEIAKIILGIIILQKTVELIGQKEYLKIFTTIIFASFCFTRTNETFHEISAWFAILTAIVIFTDFQKIHESKNYYNTLLSIFLVISFSVCFHKFTENIFKKQQPISEIEKAVIEQTSEGEKIFYDIYSYPTTYFVYKNRLPVNRLTFVLPWWLDWYELDTIDDLITNRPQTVVYDEDLKAWEISGYDDYFKKNLHENYEQTTKSSKIWKLKH